MENKDNQCFKWSITRAPIPVERDSERITKILKVQPEKLNWSGIQFPVAADANVISKFEKNKNVKINFIGCENYAGIYPLYISTTINHQVNNLMIISDGDKKHYCWIKKLQQIAIIKNGKVSQFNALL